MHGLLLAVIGCRFPPVLFDRRGIVSKRANDSQHSQSRLVPGCFDCCAQLADTDEARVAQSSGSLILRLERVWQPSPRLLHPGPCDLRAPASEPLDLQ
jgi:hypothetical protein